METKRICPSCSRPLAAGAPQGLCPECLMKAGFGTGVAPEPGEPTNQPPFTPPPLAEMAKLFPQLEIVELLGRGGMGAVYKARQPAIDRWVALKVLPPQSTARPGFAERFNREARALARLSHPNIVALYEFGQVGGMPYFVMEYVEGVTLRHLAQVRRIEPREALKIVPQICEALQFAHDEGVVHRDIKPENILLDKKGRVKIADFGIAKIMGGTAQAIPSPGLTATLSSSDGAGVRGEGLTQDQVLGTPNYMAPEQVEHPQTVDHRADIYSLGVVFYEMLTGELPLGKFAPPSRMVKVDVRLDEVVLQALEKEPERRYQTAAQFKTGVETISSSSSPATGTAASPAHPAATRGCLRAALIVGVLVWLVVTGTVTLITWIRPESWKAVAVISCPLKLPPGRPVEEHFKFVATMIELMRSDFILGRVIDRLKLDERWGKRDNGGLKLTKEQTTVLLKRRLDARSEGGTLIQVGVFGKRPEEPEEAIEIANTVGEELRAFRIEQHDSPADVLEITLRFTPPDILLGIAVGFVLGLLAGGLVLLRGFLRRGSQASQVKTAVETLAGTPPPADRSHGKGNETAGKALKRMGLRLLLLFVIHFSVLEVVDQASVLWEESAGELWTLALLAGSLPALVWAFWPGFRLSRSWLFLAGGTTVSFFLLLALDNIYNWHLRPNLGLYQEPNWVSQHPGFQRELRQRIQNNLWRKPAVAPAPTNESTVAVPATAQTLSFGPTIERVLPDPDDGRSQNATLRLRTGQLSPVLVGAPKESGGRLRRLAGSEGDLFAEYDDFVGGRWAFVTAGLKLSDFLTRQWDKATPADLNDALKEPSALQRVEHSGATLYLLPDGLLPLTLAFESREGGHGLLQITRLNDNPRTVTIRYKLVRPELDPDATGSRKSDDTHRKFVRLVVDQAAMTFEGKPTTWDGIGALLEAVTDRTNTVLECAVTSDQITVQQQNEWTAKCQALAHALGFEYASFIGIHPLGSKGTPQPERLRSD